MAGLAEDGAWIVTHPFDARATHVLPINPDVYTAMMGLEKTPGVEWTGWQEPTAGLRLLPQGAPPAEKITFPYTTPTPQGFSEWGTSGLIDYQRTGIYQRVFGWLSFPDPWTPGTYQLADSDALFAQRNFYIHVPGSASAEEKR